MKWLKYFGIQALVVFALSVTLNYTNGAERGIALQTYRTALLIGNSNYKNAPLKNPAHDAEDMAETLRNLGFEVTLKIDADQRTMEDAVRSFGKRLRSGGSGHGSDVAERGHG